MKPIILRTFSCTLQLLLISSLVSSATFPAPAGSNHSHVNVEAVPFLEEYDEQYSDFQTLLSSIDLSQIDENVKSELISSIVVPQYFQQFSEGFFHQEDEEDEEDDRAERLFAGIHDETCKGHIMEFMKRSENLTKLLTEDDDSNTWVLQMLDSWGKMPEGILSGHVNVMGDFDECIEVKVRDLEIRNTLFPDITATSFEGRYCTIYISDYWTSMNTTGIPVPPGESTSTQRPGPGQGSPGHMPDTNGSPAVSLGDLIAMIQDPVGVQIVPSMGVCVPNSCSRNDIQQFLVNALDMVYTNLTAEWEGRSTRSPETEQDEEEMDIDPPTYPQDYLWPLTIACYEEKKPDFDAADISVMVILAAFLAFGAATGIIDFWLNHTAEQRKNRSTLFQYAMAFSMHTNLKAWMSTKRPAGDFGCLHGLRFFSTAWIILAHTYYAVNFLPQWNMVGVKNVHMDWTVLTVLNSSLSVDTFFVIAGMLISFNTIKTLDRSNGKLNVPKMYIKRYFRLTPPYAILVGVMATLIPYMGNGPYWMVMNNWAKYCQDNWWSNLLYVNNLVRTENMCQGETWYLANDMQFCILSPFIIYPLWKWEKIGVALLSLYTVLSCIAPMLVVHIAGVSPTVIPTRDFQDWYTFRQIYIRPYTRIATYLVGIWLGWLLFKTKGKKVKLPWFVVLGFWTLSTAVAPAVVYGIYPWFNPNSEINKVESMAYAGLGRFSFGMSIAWIIFACVKGYGGIVNSILSWKVLMPLARLCYCVYLVSLHLQMILHVRFTQPIKYDPLAQANFFLSHMVMSFLVGLIFWLLFEQPFLILQKLIFDSPPKKKKPVISDQYAQTILKVPDVNKESSVA